MNGILWYQYYLESGKGEELEGTAGKKNSNSIIVRKSSGEESYLKVDSDFLLFSFIYSIVFFV